MSLPSQYSRPSGNARSYMSRSKGPSRKRVAISVAAVAGVAIAIWGFSRLGGSGESGALGPQAATAANNPATVPAGGQIAGLRTQEPAAAVPAPAPVVNKPVVPPPVELRQGRTRPEPGASAAAPAATAPPQAPPSRPAPAVAADDSRVTDPLKSGAPATPSMGSGPAMTAGLPTDLQAMVTDGFQRLASGDAVAARVLLSRALADARMPEGDAAALRGELARISDDLVFSTRLAPGDPYVLSYAVQSGDSLVRINQKNGLGPDWRLIQRINRMSNANRLSLGQRLKLVRGPFHAVVNKSAFRLDLWMGPTDKPEQWVYVRSFPVGLGEHGSTPPGQFIVKKGSKLVDPPWVNPRTGERFAGNDPKNPIGKFWIGIEGVGESSQHVGYGIHGTIEPDSIGQQRSMGCVRMAEADVAMMYELMGEQVSTVRIVP